MSTAETGVDLVSSDGLDRIRSRELWRRLRAERPVSWHPPQGDRPGFWVLTRYADVVAVFRDPEHFSSRRGNMLGTLTSGGDRAGGRMLVVTDPPRHGALRRAMQPGFAGSEMRRITESVRAVAKSLVAEAVERGQVDFVADVAARVPLAAICDLLDVPAADRERMLELTSLALGGDGSSDDVTAARRAQSDIMQYYADLIARRRGGDGEDVLSLLASAEVDGRRLSDSEAFLNAYNLIIGGDETTRLSSAGGVLALAEHPDQWELLRDDPGVVDTAVEEIFRWTTPVAHIARTVAADVTVAGAAMAPGDIVTLWQISANHDEEVFAEADSFDVRRKPNRHITFGVGPHYCIGAALARVELSALLSELRAQVKSIQLAEPVEHLRSNTVHGPKRMPVLLSAR